MPIFMLLGEEQTAMLLGAQVDQMIQKLNDGYRLSKAKRLYRDQRCTPDAELWMSNSIAPPNRWTASFAYARQVLNGSSYADSIVITGVPASSRGDERLGDHAQRRRGTAAEFHHRPL